MEVRPRTRRRNGGGRLRDLRVLHLMGTLRPSGMERMLVSASTAFDSDGVQGLVVGQGAGHTYVRELQQAGYPVRLIPEVRSPAGAAALYRLIRTARPDVVHVHTEGWFLPTVLICAVAMRNRSIVHTVHNVFTGSAGWRVRRRVQTSVADRLLHAVVAPSPDVQANERGFSRSLVLVYNWVDDRFFSLRQERSAGEGEPEVPGFVVVGNCSPAKNHEAALAAVLGEGGSVLHLGDESGASEAERELLEALEAEGRLRARGVLPPDEALLGAEAFLMPSRNEGMGVALAEAMVVGVPALVADAPGLRWAAGCTGVQVVDVRPAAWRRAIREFLAGARPSAGAPSVDFSAERGAREYAELYRSAAHRVAR